ncbi:MAG: hypothetical protein V4750_10745, partial [Pseudomonadota bacterium]
RCARVLWPLLTRGEWRYADDGILDRTHLRFFTRRSAIDLAGIADLRVDRCLGSVRPNTRLAKLDRWTRGLMREFTSMQYLVASSLNGGVITIAPGLTTAVVDNAVVTVDPLPYTGYSTIGG